MLAELRSTRAALEQRATKLSALVEIELQV